MEKMLSSQAINWREGRRLRALELKERGWKQTETLLECRAGIMSKACADRLATIHICRFSERLDGLLITR
jgi:hypothetical protein